MGEGKGEFTQKFLLFLEFQRPCDRYGTFSFVNRAEDGQKEFPQFLEGCEFSTKIRPSRYGGETKQFFGKFCLRTLSTWKLCHYPIIFLTLTLILKGHSMLMIMATFPIFASR